MAGKQALNLLMLVRVQPGYPGATMKFSDHTKNLAKKLALRVNAGDWNNDYTEAQKIGWHQKIDWVKGNI